MWPTSAASAGLTAARKGHVVTLRVVVPLALLCVLIISGGASHGDRGGEAAAPDVGGRVVELETGEGLESVQVDCTALGGSGAIKWRGKTRTNSRGEFRLVSPDSEAVKFLIRVRVPSPYMRVREFPLKRGASRVVHLRRGGEVRGRIVNEGPAAPPESLAVMALWDPVSELDTGEANASLTDGAFQLSHLPRGEKVRIALVGLAGSEHTSVQVGARTGAENVVLVVKQGESISGRVVLGGEESPTDPACVAAIRLGPGRPFFGAQSRSCTIDDGHFELRGLLPGAYHLVVRDESGSVLFVSGQVESGGTDVLLGVPSSTLLNGHVRGVPSGEDVTVGVWEEKHSLFMGNARTRRGRFSISVPPGSYTVLAQAGTSSAILERAAPGRPGLEVVLEPSRRLRASAHGRLQRSFVVISRGGFIRGDWLDLAPELCIGGMPAGEYGVTVMSRRDFYSLALAWAHNVASLPVQLATGLVEAGDRSASLPTLTERKVMGRGPQD